MKRSVLSILFSTELDAKTKKTMSNEQKVINSFFSNLRFEDDLKEGKVSQLSKINIGSLLEILDLEKRWMYMGTDTQPPCRQDTLWNVLSTVYPIDTLFIEMYVANVLSSSNELTFYDPNPQF